MTDHVVSWDSVRGVLVGVDHGVLTNAQDAKARAYLRGGHIKHESHSVPSEPAWGEPYVNVETYTLAPIAGCRVENRVTIRTQVNGADEAGVSAWSCTCQAFLQKRRACSHVLAVERYRRRAESAARVAGAPPSNGAPSGGNQGDAEGGQV